MLACMHTGASLYTHTAGSSLFIWKHFEIIFLNSDLFQNSTSLEAICMLVRAYQSGRRWTCGWYKPSFLHVDLCVFFSFILKKKIKSVKWLMHCIIIWFHVYLCIYPVTCRIPSSPRDMNPLEPTYFELNQRPLPLAPNHITLSDMGTPDRTHTASFCSLLSVNINSHSSRALSCLKLHLWIIDHLLPERPQCGIMRI